MKWVENITDDGGKTFETYSDEVLFGAYFFLSDVEVLHKLNRYDLFSFFSQIGGLLNTIIFSISIFMITYNGKATASSVIQNMYYNPVEVEERLISHPVIIEDPSPKKTPHTMVPD